MDGDGKEHSRHDGRQASRRFTAVAKTATAARFARPSPSSTAPAARAQRSSSPAQSGGKPAARDERHSDDRRGCWKRSRRTAPFRKSRPTAPARRPITPSRVCCRPTAKTRRASPSLSAVSASAPPAPPTLFRSCRRRSPSRSRPTAPMSGSWPNARARERHEVLLQTPMEPFDYPDNDPGPQTLLTTLTPRTEHRPAALADEPVARLCRHRSASWARALPQPRRRWRRCCSETAKRGLIFVDDGASTRSVASQIAGSNNLPFAKADIDPRRRADAGRNRPRAGPAGAGRARARHRRRRSPPRSPARSRASPTGQRRSKAAASCWYRSPWWR